MDLPKKEKRLKKVYKKKANMSSRSNILKKIVECLINKKHRHMLYWKDRSAKEFTIVFVHMNAPEFKKNDYLALFKDLDELSKNYEKYKKEENYKHECKVRCKANLRKLCESEALTCMEKNKKGKSIQFRTYKLNDDSLLGVDNPSGGGNMNAVVAQACIPALNAVLNGLKSCFTIEEKDKLESRKENELLASKVLILKTNRNADILVENSPMYDVGGCFGIEGNNKCESIGDNALFASTMLNNGTIHNVPSASAKFIDNTILDCFGSCFSNEEKDKCESMDAEESLDPKMPSNWAAQNIEEFQDTNVESNQLVPSSPLDDTAMYPDQVDEYDKDYKNNSGPLQRYDNPLWSSTSSDLSSANSSDCFDLPSDIEDFYSFGNLGSCVDD